MPSVPSAESYVLALQSRPRCEFTVGESGRPKHETESENSRHRLIDVYYFVCVILVISCLFSLADEVSDMGMKHLKDAP